MAWFDDGGALNVFADVVFCCILLFASYLPHIYGRETWRSTPVVGEGDKAHVEQSVDYFARDGEAPDTVLDDDTVVRPPPEMELPHDENTQIASSADDDDRVEVSSASSSFKHLPRCVALEIMMALPPEVVLALSMVGHPYFVSSIIATHPISPLSNNRQTMHCAVSPSAHPSGNHMPVDCSSFLALSFSHTTSSPSPPLSVCPLSPTSCPQLSELASSLPRAFTMPGRVHIAHLSPQPLHSHLPPHYCALRVTAPGALSCMSRQRTCFWSATTWRWATAHRSCLCGT
jgi:hypothetical protein